MMTIRSPFTLTHLMMTIIEGLLLDGLQGAGLFASLHSASCGAGEITLAADVVGRVPHLS